MNPFFLPVDVEGGPARQALAHNGLASHAQEWNREWHRAQARAWLHATPGPGPSQDHTGWLPKEAPDTRRVVAVDAGSCAVVHLSAVHVMHQPPAYKRTGAPPVASPGSPTQCCPIKSDEPPSVVSRQPGIAGGRSLATRQASPERETVHRTTPSAQEPRSEKDTLRLHVDWADDGLRVWIGVDGDAAAVSVRAAAILAELRRSENVHLAPLALVVCNGRTLYANGARAPSLLETSP